MSPTPVSAIGSTGTVNHTLPESTHKRRVLEDPGKLELPMPGVHLESIKRTIQHSKKCSNLDLGKRNPKLDFPNTGKPPRVTRRPGFVRTQPVWFLSTTRRLPLRTNTVFDTCFVYLDFSEASAWLAYARHIPVGEFLSLNGGPIA